MLMRNCNSTLWATTSKHSRYEDFAEEEILVMNVDIKIHARLTVTDSQCYMFTSGLTV